MEQTVDVETMDKEEDKLKEKVENDFIGSTLWQKYAVLSITECLMPL